MTVDQATLPQPALATFDLDSGTTNPDSITLVTLTRLPNPTRTGGRLRLLRRPLDR